MMNMKEKSNIEQHERKKKGKIHHIYMTGKKKKKNISVYL
jgi:hypothetical protein